MAETRHKYSIPLTLFFATIVSRLPFTSRVLYDLDSIQFALGIREFNVTLHQPHPPGYIIYIMLGKLLTIITNDAHTSFLVISIVFSALAVVAVYYAGTALFTKEIGVMSAVLALTSPSIWFHGEVCLSYIIEAFFTVLVALLCWKILNGRHKYIYASAIILALAGGVRQNTIVFLFPMWLFSVRKVPVKKIIVSVLLLAAVVSVWFIPMIILSGGLAKYQAAMNELYERISGTRSIFKVGLLCLKLHLPNLIRFTIFGIGFGAIFLVVHLYATIRKGAVSRLFDTKSFFFIAWIIPSVLFYIFIFLHPANAGYTLIFVPGLIILAANSLTYCGEACRKFLQGGGGLHGVLHGRLSWLFAVFIIITNLLIFFAASTQVSLSEIRTVEKDVQLITDHVSDNYSPGDVVILCDDLHYLGFRHTMYYLPDYRVFQTVPMGLHPDRGIFWALNRSTKFSPSVIVPKGVKDCLIVTHPQLMKEKVMQIEDALSPGGMELISLSEGLGIIMIDVKDAPKVYNNISFEFDG